MEVIRSLIQNLVVIVILAMFLEMLLPAGDMRKYVKMVMGLLIIVAVIQAVGDLLHRDYTGDLPSLTEKKVDERLSLIMESGKKISSEQQQKAIEQYKRGLANQVMALASINKEIPVVDADVVVNTEREGAGYGQISKIVMFVEKPGDNDKFAVKENATGIEPVTVQVGPKPETKERVNTETGPAGEAVAGLIKTIANFYNLKPEQVDCVYR
ncbi:MAG: Stage III sporulation protein AF (Spore_III_AF) [Pelotomaculum sp. PtaB.Bin013]|uniref:Stage III sporulation protein AF n=1 Tax=Pelotomaculum isophthalicicum JI TaxID=947010 RepID=A0A9X4H0S2_9FIRM|nr:stage III sporulation protein AF [Pelotomaculum isophthalicicum]MDF9407491.1 stage III sporulation protein AF [Pelotomaculum isophthalicicum JI]OPX91988.1 MAG: Stage III sporulation protein AF (Spore_III_AF) [Pelotomaculum sp. PtaB.Bin013]